VIQCIDLKLEIHRAHIRHLQQCVAKQLALPIQQRDGESLRFLYTEMKTHELVIEELDRLRTHAEHA